jgi:hypothetical protein
MDYKLTLFDNHTLILNNNDSIEIYRESWNKARKKLEFPAWRKIKVEDLWYLYTNYKNKHGRSVLVYIRPILNFSEKDIDLPIHPYVLGCLLGDGGLSARAQTVMTSADPELIEKINSFVEEGSFNKHSTKYVYSLKLKPGFTRSNIRKYINSENLNVTSPYKFIPEIYKQASKNQKIEIIKGLLDTDGTVGKNGGISYSSCSERLARDFAQLVRDIGGMANVCVKIKTGYMYKGVKRYGLPAYVLHVRYPTPNSLFFLERKRQRLGETNQYSANFKIRINKMEICEQISS